MADPVEVPEDGLKRFVDTDQMRIDVGVNTEDLDNAMMTHASMYVYYATNTVNARRQYERIKNAVEILEARLDAKYREEFTAEGKKVTESVIIGAVKMDKAWSAAQSKEIEAQTIWKLCEIAESALVQRKDLILEIARDRRKEREGQLRVMGEQDSRDRVMDIIAKAKAA